MASGIIFVFATSFFLFPQSNFLYSVLLVAPLLTFGPALVYSMLAAVMPRTGGDYVYVTRILHPALGFMSSWIFTIIIVTFFADVNVFFPSTSLNVFIATVGQVTNNQTLIADSTWFTTPTGELVVGTLVNFIIPMLMIFGRAVWVYLRIIFAAVMIGTVLNIVFIATASQTTFISAWNSLTSSTPSINYANVMQTAIQHGFQPGWNWNGAVAGMAYATFAILGFQFAAYSGSEAKNATKSIPIAVMGSVVATSLIIVVWVLASYHAFGFDFFAATNYLANCGCSSITFPISTTINSLYTIIPQSPLLIIIEAFCFTGAWLWAAPTNYIVFVRNVFAWSFDRVGPSWLADINERYNTPIKAIIVSIILGEIFTILFIYTSIPTIVSNTVIMNNFVYLLASIAAIFFPYRLKDVFAQSPSWVRTKVGGIPVVSLVGVFSTGVVSFLLYNSFQYVAVGGSPSTYPWVIVFAVSGLVVYYAARLYRKRQGIDLTTLFNVIPPE